MKKVIYLFGLSLVAVSIVGCNNMTKQDAGVLTGGAVGALVGSQFGQGSGQSLAIAAGAVGGALIGSQIGKYMDATDRMEMNRVMEHTKTNATTSWRNPDSGRYYRVKPTKTFYQDNEPCRKFTQTIWIGGKKEEARGTACRESDGTWKIVS